MAPQKTTTPTAAPKPFKRHKAPKGEPTRKPKIDFRVTELEKDLIVAKADECGLTTSDYVRQVVLGYQPKARLTEDQVTLLQDVRKIRYDLQQMSNFFSREDSASWRATHYYLDKAIAKLKPLLKL